MRTHRLMSPLAVLVLLVASVFSTTASAVPIRIVAGGTLTQLFPASLPTGTAWSIDWTIDSDAADSNPSANAGEFSGLTGATNLGSLVVVPGSGSGAGYVSVQDGESSLGIGWDLVQMVIPLVNGPVIDGVQVEKFILNLPTAQYDLFASDALANIVGLQLVDLDGFPLNLQVQLFNPTFSSRYFGRANISSLSITMVPVPPTVWLFGSALGVMGWMRRKANKQANRAATWLPIARANGAARSLANWKPLGGGSGLWIK